MTHWTQAGPGAQNSSTVPILVEEIIKNTAGEEVLRTRAELGDVGEREQAFIFKGNSSSFRFSAASADHTTHSFAMPV